MKSKFLTKLKDVNENAQAQEKDMHCWIFFSSEIFMYFCVAQKRMIFLNKMIFVKWNQNFEKLKDWFELVLFEFWKAHRRTENKYIREFFFKCDFHVFLRGARTQDLLNKLIFLKWNQSFYQRWKLWLKTHRRKENTYIIEFFFKCDFHVFLRGARTQDFAK